MWHFQKPDDSQITLDQIGGMSTYGWYDTPITNLSTHEYMSIQMDEALYHKFTQHNDLRAELLATGDAELVEVNNPFVDAMFHLLK